MQERSGYSIDIIVADRPLPAMARARNEHMRYTVAGREKFAGNLAGRDDGTDVAGEGFFGGKEALLVEVDGPFHFATNMKTRLGSTRMKHRHLRQCGERYVCICVCVFVRNVCMHVHTYVDPRGSVASLHVSCTRVRICAVLTYMRVTTRIRLCAHS